MLRRVSRKVYGPMSLTRREKDGKDFRHILGPVYLNIYAECRDTRRRPP